MKIKETYINTLIDSMTMEDLQQYVANDMADFLYYFHRGQILTLLCLSRQYKLVQIPHRVY